MARAAANTRKFSFSLSSCPIHSTWYLLNFFNRSKLTEEVKIHFVGNAFALLMAEEYRFLELSRVKISRENSLRFWRRWRRFFWLFLWRSHDGFGLNGLPNGRQFRHWNKQRNSRSIVFISEFFRGLAQKFSRTWTTSDIEKQIREWIY